MDPQVDGRDGREAPLCCLAWNVESRAVTAKSVCEDLDRFKREAFLAFTEVLKNEVLTV